MKDATVDLWALDEVHFQQQGSRCRMWVPPEEKDPIVYHHPPAQKRRVFRRRATPGRGAGVSPRDREIQRPDLLGVPQSAAASQRCSWSSRARYQ